MVVNYPHSQNKSSVMTRLFKLSALVAATALSACSSEAIRDANTDSAFRTPSASGSFGSALDNQRSGVETNADGDGFAYRTGGEDGEGFIAEAGILPGSDVIQGPPSGNVFYSGTWELARITGINISGDEIYGFSATDGGAIILEADFGDNTLTGASGDLSIDGRISGGQLDGTVTYLGVDGALDGLVGSDTAVGAFHGDSGSTIYAGGFVADAF